MAADLGGDSEAEAVELGDKLGGGFLFLVRKLGVRVKVFVKLDERADFPACKLIDAAVDVLRDGAAEAEKKDRKSS
jgi:hypothetical protein